MTRILPGLLFILLFTACGGGKNSGLIDEAPMISETYVDDMDRTVVLRHKAERVVSLAPSITEMIFAIHAEDMLLARSHADNFPPEVEDIPFVRSYPELDLSELARLEPDLVLGTDELYDERHIPVFEKFDIKLYVQSFDSIGDIFRNIGTLGRILHHEVQAQQLVDSLRRIRSAIADSSKGKIQYATAVLVSTDPIIVSGGGGYINEMIELAGGRNAFGHLDEKYPEITLEAFLKAQPEVLLIPTRNDKAYNEFVNLYPTVHLQTPAAQNQRVFVLDPDLVFRPGPRVMEGVATFLRILHPNVDTFTLFE